MLLSILICSLETRRHLLDRLLKHLKVQTTPDVEILTDVDNGQITIGAKRNRLLSRSVGDYLCFFDDDDLPAADYVRRLRNALKPRSGCLRNLQAGYGPDPSAGPPDCVGFDVRRLQSVASGSAFAEYRPSPSGVGCERFRTVGIARHTIANGWQWSERKMDAVDARRYAPDEESPELFWFLRCPNHLTPVRREIALATRFPEKNIGEDRDYATAMMLNGLLKSEVFIDGEPMYDYLLRDHGERIAAGEVVHAERWIK